MTQPHLLYVAYGFPPAVKSGAYRMRGVANLFAERGWRVTALTLPDAAWDRESGIDPTLMRGIDEGVIPAYLDAAREDLEPDIRSYSRRRARDPQRWLADFRKRSNRDFPEIVFGGWRGEYERAALAVHAELPVDLTLVSPQPNVQLTAALALAELNVPYAIDFRDAWSLDVVSGEVVAAADSPIGRWEKRAVDGAVKIWVVNEPIRDYYAGRYPSLVPRLRVVRNGFDPDLTLHADMRARAEPPLRFGYVGTASFKVPQLQAMLAAWITARRSEPALREATLEFRGHVGSGHARGANQLTDLMAGVSDEGVSYGGPASKAELEELYQGWDALLLALIGGEFVTSGKVYEYMATGLPIVSAHARRHDASRVLEDYPLWCAPRSASGLDVEELAETFAEAARAAMATGPAEHARAVAHATQYERRRVLGPAVAELASSIDGVS